MNANTSAVVTLGWLDRKNAVKNTFRSNPAASTVFGRHLAAKNSRYRSTDPMTETNLDLPAHSINATKLRRPRHQALPFEPRRSNHPASPPTTQSSEDYPHILTTVSEHLLENTRRRSDVGGERSRSSLRQLADAISGDGWATLGQRRGERLDVARPDPRHRAGRGDGRRRGW